MTDFLHSYPATSVALFIGALADIAIAVVWL
jgi:hypothetical protein